MQPEKSKKHPLSAKIEYCRRTEGYSRAQVAEILGFSVSTWHTRLRNPNNLTIGELIKLSKFFGTADLILAVLSLEGKEGKRILEKLKEA